MLQQAVAGSPLQAKYGQSVDRESAYERLAARLVPPVGAEPARQAETEPEEESVVQQVLGSTAFESFARSAASSLGPEITRGLFGSRRRRR